MTSFEEFLLDNGYEKFALDCKTMKYEKHKNHIISTMVNLVYFYIPKTNKVLLDKISRGEKVGSGITYDDRKGEIVFGLREYGKPSTLIFPRPFIEVKRKVSDSIVTEDENYDDSMNVVLRNHTNKEVFDSLFNNKKIFRIDLTKD